MKMLIHILLLAGGCYLTIALLLFVMQSRLVHLPGVPGRMLQATPDAVGLDYESVWFTARDGVRLHGWWVPVAQSRAVLLFFHGNAGNISHRLDSLRIFADLGLSVLIFDYRGYGNSAGRPEEAGLYRDAQAAWDYLTRERGLSESDIVLFGRSLGGAVAAHLAARRQPAGLIVESAFTSAPDMAAELYPWLPARRLARLRYATRDYLASVQAPVLIVHSRDDEIVPFHHGRRLYEAASEPKAFLELRGDHNGGFLRSETVYRQGLESFLERVMRVTDPAPDAASRSDRR